MCVCETEKEKEKQRQRQRQRQRDRERDIIYEIERGKRLHGHKSKNNKKF
jgi:hypothetical protein